MNMLMIAAPASGSGKTTITMGLLRALRRRGLDVAGFKVGPDYIDPAFLTAASGKPARNLDLHLHGEHGVAYQLRQASADYGIIEGVMGYFDGIGNTWRNSSYHLASVLNIPTVLVYSPKGEMFSVIPKLQGMAQFPGSTIQAVILNNVAASYYELLREAIEEHTALNVLGYLPKAEDASLNSRHLGLVQSVEVHDLDQKIELIADQIEAHVNLSALLDLMRPPRIPDASCGALERLPQTSLTVAIAKDEAFSFYYAENLELLERCCRVVYFSPLRDAALPECDLLYLGGGYPEVFHLALSENISMRQSIKEYIERGGCVYAECGGFMYLTEAVENAEMVGIFLGTTRLTPQLQRFGYIDIELKRDCLLGKRGERLTGHEFHKSLSNVADETVFQIRKTGRETTWECGFAYKNVIAGYPHISFLGNPSVLPQLLDYVEHAL
ncbi:cobyrinic acid A,C-diamide synthase [Candidatus Moduliflexus flocculans]|uniref:Cobyrinate a,c-diamide synthase n=1 Tax=Candidatus Moduliflexus flocculans TaxID=1499966 RepID=A0A0S6VQ30_9BACT|nr:cobyrinic acid A,C-diamide synthase [Candidatus Moduliflexus flocculans]